VVLAALHKRQIGKSGMLAGEAPSRLTMPRQTNHWTSHAHKSDRLAAHATRSNHQLVNYFRNTASPFSPRKGALKIGAQFSIIHGKT
jgi:hypothetical protein